MISLIDYILSLFRDETKAQAFVRSPEQAMRDAGLGHCTPAQVQAVAATAAPTVALGHGDPVVGLQKAVAKKHAIAYTAPQHHDVASHNVASNNVASPTIINEGPDVNLKFGDITFGNKTTAVGDGAVAVGGNNSGDILSGDGAVKGNGNTVNNGDVRTGDGSPVTLGNGNKTEATSEKAKGDIIKENEGPVVKDVKTEGGNVDLDNRETVLGNKTDVDVKGDLNGQLDAGNTNLENVGNTDNSTNNSGNTTGSHNTTDSHNTHSEATGFQGGNIGGDVLGGIF